MKKTKIDKDNSGKKKEKKNHIGKRYNNQQCFKEKTTKLNS